MSIKKIVMSTMLLATACCYAQEQSAAEARIMQFKKCFVELLTMTPQYGQLSAGDKELSVAMERNYEKENFNVSDRTELEDLRVFVARNSNLGAFAITDYASIGDVLNPDKLEFLNDKCYNRPSTFHILAHGIVGEKHNTAGTIQIDNQQVGPEEMAAGIIKLLENYERVIKYENKPFTVVVHSCKAGDGEDSFAAQLSALMAQSSKNIYVVGAPDDIYPTFDLNGGYYQEKIAKNADDANNATVEGMNWNIFHDGKLMSTGASTYDKTIDIIEFGSK